MWLICRSVKSNVLNVLEHLDKKDTFTLVFSNFCLDISRF